MPVHQVVTDPVFWDVVIIVLSLFIIIYRLLCCMCRALQYKQAFRERLVSKKKQKLQNTNIFASSYHYEMSQKAIPFSDDFSACSYTCDRY